jgi:hypothetical protein
MCTLPLPLDIIQTICDKRKELFANKTEAFEKLWIESTGKWATRFTDQQYDRITRIGPITLQISLRTISVDLPNNTCITTKAYKVQTFINTTFDDSEEEKFSPLVNSRHVDWIDETDPLVTFTRWY